MQDWSYNPAPVLFRLALAAAERARLIATGKLKVTANAQQRETDNCIAAIFLSHAAVETAWHWEQAQAGVTPHRWPDQFEEALLAVSRARHRSDPTPPDQYIWDRWLDLNALRNFLQHGDGRARERIEKGGLAVPYDLTAGMAEIGVRTGKELGDYIADASGGQRLFDTNWKDPQEL